MSAETSSIQHTSIVRTKPLMTMPQILVMNFGFFGIQYSFGMQQTAVTNGNRNRQMLQPIAPIRKNGLRRPHRGLQVRSERAPISGWISRPVIGPARLRIGRSWGLAPRNSYTGFTAVCCMPKLY